MKFTCALISLIFCTALNALAAERIEPFEINGKWGFMNPSTNMVVVKPKYYSIRAVPETDLFIVSDLQKRSEAYGVINSMGGVLIPLNNDSITLYHDYLICYGKDNLLRFLNINSQETCTVEGRVDKIYPGGIICATNDKHFRRDEYFLINSRLEQITDDRMELAEIIPGYIIMREKGGNLGYQLFSISTFEPGLRVCLNLELKKCYRA